MGSSESSQSTCCCSNKKSISYKPIGKKINGSRHKQDRSTVQIVQNDILAHQTYAGDETETIKDELLTQQHIANDSDSIHSNELETQDESHTNDTHQMDITRAHESKRRATRTLFAIDFDVFASETTNCFGTTNSNIVVSECHALYRLLSGFQYYASLNIPRDASYHDTFTAFCEDTYNIILDDYIHVMSVHSQQFKEIHAQLARFYIFHPYLPSTVHVSNDACFAYDHDAMFVFYRDLFDSVYNVLWQSTNGFIEMDSSTMDDVKRRQWIHPQDVMQTYEKLCNDDEQHIGTMLGENFNDIVHMYLNMNSICANAKDLVLVSGYIRSNIDDGLFEKINELILTYYQ